MPQRQRLQGRRKATPAPSSGFYPSLTCRKTDLASFSFRRVALRDERQPSSTHKQKEARTRLTPGPRHHVGPLRESHAEEQGHAHLIYCLLGYVLPPGLYGAHEEPAANLGHGTTQTPRRHLGPHADNAERGDVVGPRGSAFWKTLWHAAPHRRAKSDALYLWPGRSVDATRLHERLPHRKACSGTRNDASPRLATHGACVRTLQTGALRHGTALDMEAAVRGCRGEAGCATARP